MGIEGGCSRCIYRPACTDSLMFCVQINIASSVTGSRMSLNASSADEGNDDDFGDAISLVQGIPGPSKRRRNLPGEELHVNLIIS